MKWRVDKVTIDGQDLEVLFAPPSSAAAITLDSLSELLARYGYALIRLAPTPPDPDPGST